MDAAINAAWVDIFRYVIPELVLGAAACFLFLAGTLRPQRDAWGVVALLALAGAALALAASPQHDPGIAGLYAGSLVLDRLALLTKAIALAGGAVLVLLSWKEAPPAQAAEFHACILLITAGLCLTGSANELITLFLALELISIPTYVLLYLPRHDRAAQEAAMKYFLLSVFSSALLLFGFSYLYGLGGTTNLQAIAEALTPAPRAAQPLLGMASVALVMVVAGLGFRITAVPFHFYAPDVYQGAPASAAALLAFVPKVAGFLALFRVLGFVLAGGASAGLALTVQVPGLLWIIAAVTMTLGNVLALLQDNLRRILAYSSVAHAGYMLIGLAVAQDLRGEAVGGTEAVLFYLVAYGAMTLGAFTVLIYLNTPERPVETVDDLAGLSRSHPGIALVMGLFLLSLIGMPLTAGFIGKFLLFVGAMSVPGTEHARLFRTLALIGALNAAIGAWYYLRILVVMYLRTPVRPLPAVRSLPGLAAILVCAALTLVLGIYPEPLMAEARLAVGKSSVAQRPDR